MELNDARARWQALHDLWAEVHVEALAARSLCIAKFRSGEGPSIAELDLAETLEAQDEVLRGTMDEFTGKYFGQ